MAPIARAIAFAALVTALLLTNTNGVAQAATTAGTISVASSRFEATSSQTSVTVKVSRTGGSSGAASATYSTISGSALPGKDYTNTTGTLKWAAGDASTKTFVIPLLHGPNSYKIFWVRIANVTGATLGTSTARITQTGWNVASLSTSANSVAATAKTLTITVTRQGDTGVASSVKYSTTAGTAIAGKNFTATQGSLSWLANDTTPKTFVVPILNGQASAASIGFTVNLVSPVNMGLYPPSTSTVTITGASTTGSGGGTTTPPVTTPPPSTSTAPGAPTGMTATAGNASVALKWTAGSGATSYLVGRSTSATSGYNQIAAPTTTSFTDNTVANGTKYYYIFASVNSAGTTYGAAAVSATPVAASTGGSAPPVTTPPVTTPPVTTPPVTTPPVTTPPVTTPPSGSGINWTSAPTLSGITTTPNRDSVIVRFPAVANARDFRVIVSPTGVTPNSDGTETVTGGTTFCAGVQQHQARGRYIADKTTMFPYYFYLNGGGDINPNNFVPSFGGGSAPGAYGIYDLDTPPVLAIEVTGVKASQTVTVEAMDRLCPFPGIIGRTAMNIPLTHNADTDHPGNPWVDASSISTFPVVTKAQVVAKYGTLIVNGQGWAGGPNVQANPPAKPPFAQQAAVNPPKVLARGSVTIAPSSSSPAPKDFFDDFSNSGDTFQTLPLPNWHYGRYLGGELVMQNSKWTVYGDGYTCCTATAAADGHGVADAWVDNGQMNVLLGDWSQGGLSEISMFPRKAAHLNGTSYLHVTYEVPSYATSRRYWIFTACGSSTSGQTLDSTGALKEQVVHTTFFYNPTGASPSTAGWNCLQIFNRQGNSNALSQWEQMHSLNGARPPMPANNGTYDIKDYISIAIPSISDPTKTAAYTNHPESDVVVLVNKPIPASKLPEQLGGNEQVAQSSVTSPINVSPNQLDNPADEQAWFFQVDGNGNPTKGILDDQQLASPRTKYDLYIRNNRIIMYVNGQARMCNDFTTPTTTLNIADAALGFHQILYHSSGEFAERLGDPDRGAAYHYRYNSPWLDQRSWDNIGFEENVNAPSDFNANTCFVHRSLGAENNEP